MNEKKFTEVFNKYNRLVRKMVISRSGNDMLAEEICQQVFLQYFEQMNNISEELIQPWLLLTTRNMVYDYLRKMQVRKDTHSINGIEDFMVIHEDDRITPPLIVPAAEMSQCRIKCFFCHTNFLLMHS